MRGFPFSTVNGIVSENRIDVFEDSTDYRLAMMEMRLVITRLIWEFDLKLKDIGQEQPAYDHKSLSAGKLMVRVEKVKRDG